MKSVKVGLSIRDLKIKIFNKEQQSNEQVSQDKESFKTRNTPTTLTH